MIFPPLGNSDHVVVSVSIDFPINSKQDTPFHHMAYDYSGADWDGLGDHLRDGPWEDVFKLSASEFCEWVQVGIDVYIPHCRYQVKPHSSPWFSAACAAAIVHRNHFFVCTNKINLLNLQSNSDRLAIIAKGFLKLPNLHMLLNQKSPSLPINLALGTFGRWLILFSTKVTEVLSSASDKAKYLLKTFPITLILMTLVSLYLFTLPELIRNCTIFP